MNTREARARVAHGAMRLDRLDPPWFTRIDEGVLDISDCTHCICGQLAGGRPWGECELITQFVGASDVSPEQLGLVAGSLADYRRLQDAWIAAIADRRLATAVTDPQPVMVLHR